MLLERLGAIPHALFEQRAVKTGEPHSDADTLGVKPIATATDDLAHWWGDHELLIIEPPDDEYLSGMRDAPAPRTTIGSSNAERLRGIT